MSKTNETPLDRYSSHFASTLRLLMAQHPDTGASTTQKALATFLDVRPQTVSLYCTGESLPNCEQLLKIAEYFNVTTDFLMTGKRIENAPVREMLGLSEKTVQNLKLVKDGYFEDTPAMLAMLDCLLSDKDFYWSLEKAAQALENRENADTDEYRQFCEWKASDALRAYFLEFFARDLLSIYIQNKN